MSEEKIGFDFKISSNQLEISSDDHPTHQYETPRIPRIPKLPPRFLLRRRWVTLDDGVVGQVYGGEMVIFFHIAYNR